MYSKKMIRKIYNMRCNLRYDSDTIIKYVKTHYKNYGLIKDLKKFILSLPHKDRRYEYSDEQINFLKKAWARIRTSQKIVEYFNRHYNKNLTYSSLNNMMCMRYKVPRVSGYNNQQGKDLTLSQIETIKKMYAQGATCKQISDWLGYKTSKSAEDILHKLGVKLRPKYHVKSYADFSMESIDCNFKAYLLGLLLTDGYIMTHNKGFAIQMCDYDVINFVATTIGVPVYTIRKKNPNCQIMYRTVIHGHEYVQQLQRLAITPSKSLTLQGPTLYPEELYFLPYIFRGIIDGDGWVRKDGKEFFICSASLQFIQWCIDMLYSLGMTSLEYRFKENGYSGIYYLRTALQSNICILHDVIYSSETPVFGMARKYNRVHIGDVQRL